jgi:type IV secretory pathway VirB2 component (pilin)
MEKLRPIIILSTLLMSFICPDLFASDLGGMPWEDPLNQITDSLTGPVARSIGLIALAATGLALAMGEAGGIFRRLVQVVFGLSIAFSAATWGMSLFGTASGMLI